jgi:hypothetical protein
MTNVRIWSVVIFDLVAITIIFGVSLIIIFDNCFW